MSEKSVLVVEDEDLQRRSIHQWLEWSGFEVVSAGTAAAARSAVEKRDEPFDVVVLDMKLEGEKVTGADLGMEFRQREAWKRWPAEFLINSAYSDEGYYEQALKLGVAAYLKKKNDDLAALADHVRVLALRRALSVDRPDILQRIRRIAAGSRSRREAIRRFCVEVVCAELQRSLPLDYLLLLTESDETHGFTNRRDLPQGAHPVYETVQALTHGKAGRTEPFELEVDLLEAVRATAARRLDPLFGRLDGAALVPFSADLSLKLSMGVLPADPSVPSVEEAQRLAQLLADYLRPAVLRHFLEVTAAFSELETGRRDVLRATAKFCLYVGQEQITSLNAAIDLDEIQEPGLYVRKLRALAADLVGSGELLGELVRTPAAGPGEETGMLSMREVVSSAWSEVSRPLSADEQTLLHLSDGDCLVKGRRDYLHLAVGRILQWLLQRRSEVPQAVQPALFVSFDHAADGPVIVFEDRSLKLPKRLRDQLLEPFASAAFNTPTGEDLAGPGQHLALYLAKALVEEGCGGLLQDETDKVGGEIGHRILMRLPGVVQAAAAA